MNYQIKSAVFIALTYKNSYDIYSNPNQNALFVTLILSSTSKKRVKRSRGAQFLDVRHSLNTPALQDENSHGWANNLLGIDFFQTT